MSYVPSTSTTATSGTYTPSLSAVTNISAVTAHLCEYIRIGNTVFVSGKLEYTPIGAGAANLGISLPIASTLGNDYEVAGVAATNDMQESGAIAGDVANARARILWVAAASGSHGFWFTFGYLVI